MTFFSSPRLALALCLFAAPVSAAPSHTDPVPALLGEAHAAQTRGEFELALRLAQSAIVADPARPTSYVALGDIYAGAGQQDYARTYYNEALSIDPAEPSALKAIAALDQKTPARVLITP
jgi:Flp pilus assembly protein TadD